MVETPVAVLHAEEIARASDRLACLVLGTNDLNKELGATFVPGRAPLLAGISMALLAARAAGIAIVDGVYNDVKDAEGFRAECEQGRDFGFDGKTLIHPGQVEVCNEVFAPSAAQVEDARAVIAAFEAAQAEGKGVATVNGRLVENLHVDIARKVLATSEAIGALEP
jgi:citrate lyase subunit beta/citryl-CoA lyase